MFIKAKTYCTQNTFFRIAISFILLMIGSVTGAFLVQTYNPTLIVLIAILITKKTSVKVLQYRGNDNEKKLNQINKRQFKTSI